MTMPGAEPQDTEGSGIDAREYLRILARRRWTVAITVAACLALALGYLLLAPKTYQAAATVLVKPVVDDWTATSSPSGKSVDIATEQRVAASDAVANDVRTKLHLAATSAELLPQLQVSPGTVGATTLTFTYADHAATMSRNVALTFATAYLARRQAAAQSSLTRAQQTLSTQIKALESQLAELEAKKTDPTAPQTPSESIAVNQISSLRTTLTRLSLATVDVGSLISTPPPAQQLSASPQAGLVLPAGLLLGLLLGLILAFVRDRMSNRFFFSRAAGAAMRPTVLETIPMKSRGARRRGAGGLLIADPGAPVAAAFGRASEHVRAQLTAANALVVVTSADVEPASPVVAVNLAAALAQTGTSVTLLTRLDPATVADADGAGPPASFADADGAGPPASFADALAGRAPAAGLGSSGYAGTALHVVPFGDLPPGALRTNAALDLVRLLLQRSHILLVDAPPLLAGADGLALAATADLVLITVVDQVTRRSALAVAAEHLAAVGSPLVRTIVLTGGRVWRPAAPTAPVAIPPTRERPHAIVGSGSAAIETNVAYQAKDDWIS
jgi:capsular polysaccharide biosynthesis protein